ncbi:molecular chaperone TorD [Psychrobacter phenylpyruvicus]|uniref:Chaperone protein TorD n=3 Tax=Psychrobacter phenylpyruvicus TaxID=29432 RepID=A0A379LMQ4_9GAMM|nr:molecular chaperone TorD [Psychrobacter phenylpyruvicus]SUD91823.1 Chaperone protein TorD [Psychrobacter phenylpyruvicus]
MNNEQQWQAANKARAALYRWFAEIFAREFNKQNLAELQRQYPALHQAFSELGLQAQSERLQKALNNLKVIPEADRALELAADFAHMFLLSGHQSAPPYASYYLEADKMLYGKPAQQMSQFLAEHELDLHPDFREPKDHLSIYLQVLSLWIQHGSEAEGEELARIAAEQSDFLQSALLNWLPKFNERCQAIRVKTQVYPALTDLLLHFVRADQQALVELD